MADATRSKAAADLKRKLSPPVMNQSRLAEKLGVSQQAVSSWLKGRALPEPERMAEIEKLLGIPMRDWVEPAAPESSEELVDDEADEESPSPRIRNSKPAA